MEEQWDQDVSCSPCSLRYNPWTNPGIDARRTSRNTITMPSQLYPSLLYTYFSTSYLVSARENAGENAKGLNSLAP
jgi:hypothetical protein